MLLALLIPKVCSPKSKQDAGQDKKMVVGHNAFVMGGIKSAEVKVKNDGVMYCCLGDVSDGVKELLEKHRNRGRKKRGHGGEEDWEKNMVDD